MQELMTNLTVSASEVRGVAKSIEQSNGRPVAVLSHNKVQAYIVPAEAVKPICYASAEEVNTALDKILEQDKGILDRLKDL